MSSRPPVEDAVSAGGVVWRRTSEGAVEVVVCGRNDDRLWCLPKGTPDANETIEQTAVREVEEETGLRVRPGKKLGTISYWFAANGKRFHKMVHHWLMEPVGGNISDHDQEFDTVEWVPIDVAHSMLKYENERRMVRKAAEALGTEL
jgi:8-oxo-dGTP pyrophosphatase MutT (NUDIX family)